MNTDIFDPPTPSECKSHISTVKNVVVDSKKKVYFMFMYMYLSMYCRFWCNMYVAL